MRVVIPTYMREDRQIAYRHMPASVKKLTTLFTHSGRAEVLRHLNPAADVYDLGVTDGIADVRQKIVNKMWDDGHDKVFVVDDGCRFYPSHRIGETGRKPTPTPLQGLKGDVHYRRMLAEVEELLDTYPQAGISARTGNNRHPDRLLSPGRAYSCYGLNLKTLFAEGVAFDDMYCKNNEVKLFEDFYMTLSLLTRGLPNAILYDFCFQHDHGKGGGNSTIRTNDLQKKCLEALKGEFPDFVKIVQREAKSWKLGGGDKFRWECIISWKKALEYGLKKRDNARAATAKTTPSARPDRRV